MNYSNIWNQAPQYNKGEDEDYFAWTPIFVGRQVGRRLALTQKSICQYESQYQLKFFSIYCIHTKTHLKCAIIISKCMFQTVLVWCW